MIEVRGLTHRFDGAAAVDDVDLTIHDGEFVLLVGPNGAGKTTLVKHWNGLLEPDAGEVLVDGRPVGEDPVAARTAIGMVFQRADDAFVAATVGEDVAFGPENLGLARTVVERRVSQALEAVGLAGRGGERLDALSGGERQRVAIAGALAMSPEHLVLDEPLVRLDAAGREAVLDRINALNDDGVGVVIVTHDLRDVAALADRVVVLHEGRVVRDDEPAAVVDDLARFGVRPVEC